MSLSPREKQIFFTQLSQLLRAGVPLGTAAEKLGRMSRSDVRSASRRLSKLLASDRTAAEAFEAMGPYLDPLERSTLSALSRTGRLDFGFHRLAEYFGTLAKARLEILSQSAYPIVMLHLGVLLLNVQELVGPGGVAGYLKTTGIIFGYIYGGVFLLALLIPVLLWEGATGSVTDALLRMIPFLGRPRRNLAIARFLATLDLQLDAGINVMESLQAAGEASRSGLIRNLSRSAVRGLRNGRPLGEVLSSWSGALPGEVQDRIIVAEDTGNLHRVLPELHAHYEEEGLRQLRTAANWLPKLLYFCVLGYLGWKIVSFYQNYFKELGKVMDIGAPQ